VRGLVLLCPAVAFRKLRQFVPLVRLVPDQLASLPLHLPRGVATRGLRNLFADPSRLPPTWYDSAIDEFARVLGIRANRLATFSALRHVYLDEPFGGSGFWDRLPELKPPALFLWGDRDVLVPAAFARWVHEALPEARSIVLDDCGHVPQFEHPELTVQYAMEFIDSLPS
jgi:pimeloyl-ACP methyl ester carboxylesterase